jgi:hypothetical protein
LSRIETGASSNSGYAEIIVNTPPASPRRTHRRPPEEIQLAIESFLKASKQPALFEPGEPPFDIHRDRFALDPRGAHLLLTLWDDTRNLSRKVVAAESQHRARVELTVERFGGKEGTVILADLAAARNASLPKRGTRLIHRESFRRALTRQFPGWRVAELTSDPDLAHSLSPAYPRAWLRKGTHGLAAIAATGADTANGALTFGLIWLDYLRSREPKCVTHSLCVFLPKGSEIDTALRVRYLDPSRLTCELYVMTPDGYEDLVNPHEYNNLDTRVRAREPRELDVANVEHDRLEAALREFESLEAIELHDRSISFRVRGLEIAKRHGNEFSFGIETKHALTTSTLAEMRELASLTSQLRSVSGGGGGNGNPLFRKHPERWLESQVRTRLDILDSSLCPEPVYGQAPAMAGARPLDERRVDEGSGASYRADRDVIDLLAIGRSGRLSVLELKASEDIHLPMQGLDYWIRVKWHLERGDFSGHFPGMTVSREAPRLLLVSPALDVHPRNETIIQYLAPEVEVEQIGVGVEWRKDLRVMFRRTRG